MTTPLPEQAAHLPIAPREAIAGSANDLMAKLDGIGGEHAGYKVGRDAGVRVLLLAQDRDRLVYAADAEDGLADFNGHDDGPRLAALGQEHAAPQQPYRRHEVAEVGARIRDRHALLIHAATVAKGLHVQQDAMYDELVNPVTEPEPAAAIGKAVA